MEVWLVVHARTRPELESAFPHHKDRILFIEDAWFHKLLCRMSSLLPRRIAESTLNLFNQLITQYRQRRVVRDLIWRESIDLVHQPSPVSPRFPSLMANLGVPVLVGPMNGGMEYPETFRKTESIMCRISVSLGRRMASLANSVIPGKKLAKVLLVANERTRRALPACVRGQVIEVPENGVDLKIWTPRARPSGAGDPGRKSHDFVFLGRLVDWKGVDIALEALVRVPAARLEIIGDGPVLGRLQSFARRLGVSERVVFAGWLPQTTCAERLQSAAALLLPSIYECGGAVVLEAMAMKTPVIATAWGGPIDYLGEGCGLLVEPSSREALVQGFSSAMQKLIECPELGRRLGSNGRKHVEREFDWDKKIDRMISIYVGCLQ
jgi:glycosyltransferase involved in cell wall biosynthesis